jgi:uncharacterized UBP type Zn finger protein
MLQGFDEHRARIAVQQTHECGVEPAINWLLQHSGDNVDSAALVRC